MAGERDEEPRVARNAAVEAFMYNAVGLALQVAIVVAIAKRDWLGRQYHRYRWYVLREWRGAHERRLLAELQRDLSAIEHGHTPRRTGGHGLYGGVTGGD